MDDEQRIHLQKLIDANGTEDHTEVIRRVKHSSQIYLDVTTMIKLKHDYGRLAKSNPKQFDAICVSRCAFLFKFYTDLFNRLKTGEIDLKLLFRMIQILRDIEDGKLDQHEGSFEVGKILKSIYVDSALKRSENLDAEQAKKEKRATSSTKLKTRPAIPEKKLSWSDFKASSSLSNASTMQSPPAPGS
jgi:cell division protein YceG involved in septum cleavage